MRTFRREHFSPDFEGPFCQLSKSSAREKNLDLHFAINISGNSPFGTDEKRRDIRMAKVIIQQLSTD